jgi:hypothetical protein
MCILSVNHIMSIILHMHHDNFHHIIYVIMCVSWCISVYVPLSCIISFMSSCVHLGVCTIILHHIIYVIMCVSWCISVYVPLSCIISFMSSCVHLGVCTIILHHIIYVIMCVSWCMHQFKQKQRRYTTIYTLVNQTGYHSFDVLPPYCN